MVNLIRKKQSGEFKILHLEAQMHLDGLVEKLHFPTQRVSRQDLPGFEGQVRAGQIFSLRSGRFLSFRTYQLHRPNTSEPTDDMSDAEFLPFSLRSIREETNGLPFKPAIRFQKDLNLAPSLRGMGSEMLRIGLDGSDLFQGYDKIPAFFENGLLDSFVVVGGVGEETTSSGR